MLHPDGALRVDLFNLSPPRSGNTWLGFSLDAHPSITVARPQQPGPYKAPEVFRNRSDLPFVGLLDEYRDRYRHGAPGSLLVDASTYQLDDGPRAHARIHEHNPDARFLVLLRDPVARLLDHYTTARRYAQPLVVPPTFEDALEVPGFLATSRYAHALKNWQDALEDGRMKIILDLDLREDPQGVLRSVYSFCGVNRRFVPSGLGLEDPSSRPAPEPRRRRLLARRTRSAAPEAFQSILRMRGESTDAGIIDARTARRLEARLEPDIRALEDMLGRDLDAWRAPRVEWEHHEEATEDVTSDGLAVR